MNFCLTVIGLTVQLGLTESQASAGGLQSGTRLKYYGTNNHLFNSYIEIFSKKTG